jgi:hypothetical protein
MDLPHHIEAPHQGRAPSFVRQGKGDHEIWYSPIVNRNFTVDGSITKRSSAIKTLKKAGINRII